MGHTKEERPKISVLDDKIISGCDAAQWKKHREAFPPPPKEEPVKVSAPEETKD